jgi:hypothetical protein
MKPHLMFTGLILAGVLAQPAAVMAGSVGLARFQDERPSQEEPASTDPAAETDDPAPPQEAEDPGRTTAGASVSSTGTGVGVTSRRDRFFFGGGIGLGFGDIKYVEIWPLFGYNFNPKVRGGMSLIYRYRKDERFPDSTSTTDYGGSLFVDYFPVPRFFLRGEVRASGVGDARIVDPDPGRFQEGDFREERFEETAVPIAEPKHDRAGHRAGYDGAERSLKDVLPRQSGIRGKEFEEAFQLVE